MKEKLMDLEMELGDVPQGGRFALGALTLIKLDADDAATFAVMADLLPLCAPFEDPCTDRADFNNYADSFLEKHVLTVAAEDDEVSNAVVGRPIDLTAMDGSTAYGQPLFVGRILTVNEYHKYQHIIPKVDRPYWLATPWSTNEPEWGTICNRRGAVRRQRVDAGLVAVRPALWLCNDITVNVVKTEEPQ